MARKKKDNEKERRAYNKSDESWRKQYNTYVNLFDKTYAEYRLAGGTGSHRTIPQNFESFKQTVQALKNDYPDEKNITRRLVQRQVYQYNYSSKQFERMKETARRLKAEKQKEIKEYNKNLLIQGLIHGKKKSDIKKNFKKFNPDEYKLPTMFELRSGKESFITEYIKAIQEMGKNEGLLGSEIGLIISAEVFGSP